MVKTILFDLDGTLLPLDTDEFLKRYLKALSLKVSHVISPEKFIAHLMEATQKVLEDKNPNMTNKEVFWHHFSKIQIPQNTLASLMDEFYENDFPLLGSDIQPDTEAPALVKKLKKSGFRLAIATNAIFPEKAVIERMRWASIDPDDFELITTYEKMHFCKPHIEYYEEVLDLIGERPENCLMVGNDVEEDMVAGQIGIKTFLLDRHIINRGAKKIYYDYRGDFSLLKKLLLAP